MVAVSSDQIFALNIFKLSLGNLPFELASDWMREVSQAYGVLNEKDGIARRSVFVLDQKHRLVYQNTAFEAGNRSHYEAVFDILERH
ncbi:redoxin domain-containing protein [Sulfobacillus sp. DSM 109850]|uniref:Redoxin domain-containing protein n=1 Tax=Sulfobacillus harzensis TaxID=2729629 RepID=A0A7Y0L2X0_9FIRM|nr:redoxin domain-containing protein [Sulfobacillus harzensis]